MPTGGSGTTIAFSGRRRLGYDHALEIQMTHTFAKGDRVEWKSSGGTSVGKVVRKLTSPMDIEDFHVAAFEDDPRYLVESDSSGKQAAHKPESLRKID